MKFDSTRRPGKPWNGQNLPGFGKVSILLCGSLILSCGAQKAAAHNDRPTFREFRGGHNDLDRHEVRHLYRETYNGRSTGGASLPRPIPVKPLPVTGTPSWHHIIVNDGPTNSNRTNRIEAKLLRSGSQQIGDSIVRLSSGVNLDLSSADKNIVLGENLFKSASSVEITVGSEKQILSAGSKVTAAEYIAVKQALNADAGQKLVINQSGIASGGSVDLTEITGNNDPMRASSLTVASGVTTYGDFGKRSDFNLLGDLNNYGNVVALSSSRAVRGGTIHADDITNNAGASITSILPDSPRHSVNRVDLTLDARGDLTNYGSIGSSGNLTLNAGNSISNNGNVSANDSVNLHASTVNNSSTITAVKGDINIDGPATAALNVNNAHGTLAALNGAINVRTPAYTGTLDNNINGGDLLSKEVNVNGGNATNYINVNNLTGELSQTGLASHVVASTDTLTIGSTCLTGDPTFYNTAGNIFISSSLTAAENLTIIAAGNITLGTSAGIQAGSATQGYNITMVAGAHIVSTVGGSSTSTLPATGVNGQVTLDGTGSTVALDGVSGGNIIFGTGTVSSRPTTGGTGIGGNVSLYAYAGTTNFGIIDVDSSTILTGGVGTAANGNVTIVANGVDSIPTYGRAIQIGAINTTGGTGGGGNLTVTTASPVSSGGNIVYNADGSLAAGGSLQASSTITPGASIGQNNGKATIAGNVVLTAGKDIVQGSTTATLFTDNFNAQVTLTAGGNVGATPAFPFIIEGYNKKLSKKVNGGLPGNCTITVSAGGSASVLRNATSTLSLLASSSVNDFFLQTNSALNVTGNVTSSAGEVILGNTGGALNINAVTISGFTALDIANGTKSKGTLNVGANAVLQTTGTGGSRDIFLTLDKKAFAASIASIRSIPTLASAEIPPPRVQGVNTELLDGLGDNRCVVNGTTPDKALYSGRAPSFPADPPNTFTSNNSTILLTNKGGKGAFSFGGGVNVTAGQ